MASINYLDKVLLKELHTLGIYPIKGEANGKVIFFYEKDVQGNYWGTEHPDKETKIVIDHILKDIAVFA